MAETKPRANQVLTVEQTTTSTGTVNDFALTPHASVLRCNNATLLTLTGLAAGRPGQVLMIVAVGAGQVDLANQAAGSAAANRISNGVTGTISLVGGLGSATLAYDGTTARWRVIAHAQGAWIAVPYAAGDFDTPSAMTWTVDAGDVGTFAYLLNAVTRTLLVSLFLDTTTVGGTLAATLRVLLPGGFTAARAVVWPCFLVDNGNPTNGFIRVDASGVVITIARVDNANFLASINLTYIRATTTFEVS